MAAYVRVSSASQSSTGQCDAIARAAAARGDVIGRWYEDQRSGGTLKRAALTELRTAAREGRVRVLWVFRLDRLTRTGIADTLRLLNELRGAGCVVRSVADGFDTAGPMAEMWTAILAWVAQLERQVILDRQAASRTRMEAAGRSWGRPRKLKPEREEWFLRQLKQKSPEALAASTGVSASTLRRLAKRGRSR